MKSNKSDIPKIELTKSKGGGSTTKEENFNKQTVSKTTKLHTLPTPIEKKSVQKIILKSSKIKSGKIKCSKLKSGSLKSGKSKSGKFLLKSNKSNSDNGQTIVLDLNKMIKKYRSKIKRMSKKVKSKK